jgi:hypothetical protein
VLADPMLRIRLVQNGHARVEEEFSEAAVVAAMVPPVLPAWREA